MEKVINLLNDIEEKAAKILDSTNSEKILLQKELDEKIIKLDEEIQKDTEKKLSELQNEINKEIEIEKNKLITNCNKRLDELDNYFTKKHDKLVYKVFQNIIGV